MSLKGKIIVQREVKCHGDVFHELFRHKPHQMSIVAPDHFHGCDLHEGEEFGAVGSTAFWEYNHAGKKEKIKTIIDAVDEENNSFTISGIEGDVVQLYKKWTVTLQVDKNAGDNHVVTWTFDYEKANEDVPEPLTYVEFFLNFSKDIEAHHAAK